MFLVQDCLCLSSKIMNNETVMWITNDCGVNDETSYYLYYVDNAEFSDNRFSLYMTRGISLTVSLVRSVFLVCPICIISVQEAEWAGSGVQGERHEHRGEEQRGRGERGEEAVKEKPDQSEHSEVRSEQRGGGGHRLSILWQTWSPGIIGILTTRGQISWELEVNSFNSGEDFFFNWSQFCFGKYITLIKDNFQVKYNAWRRKTKPGEKINCQENRVRLKAGRRKILNEEEFKIQIYSLFICTNWWEIIFQFHLILFPCLHHSIYL